VKHSVVLCAGMLALISCGSASAQSLPAPYPGVVYPAYGPGLPPYEVIAIVRSLGLEPLTRPFRTGPTYALRALDPAGQEVRVVVDARLGRVLGVVPVAPHHALMPPSPYGRPAARLVPDGYGPSSRIAGLAPGAGPIGVPPAGAVPPPNASSTSAPAQAGPPPLPRPRPKIANAAAPTAAKPSDAAPAPPAAASGTKSFERSADNGAEKSASNEAGKSAAPTPAPSASAPSELQE